MLATDRRLGRGGDSNSGGGEGVGGGSPVEVEAVKAVKAVSSVVPNVEAMAALHLSVQRH